MLSSFRNRMKQLDNDMNNGPGDGQDRPNGRGLRRRGHGGGDDGDDAPSDHPSSSTSQAGD
eukprot:2272310-Amphidinium_carterae.1